MSWSENLDEVPRMIDPASGCLEILIKKAVRSLAAQTMPPTRCIFWRLPPRWNYPFGNHELPPNLFGNATTMRRCRWLLGYDQTGLLRRVYERGHREWIPHDVAEEITGQISSRPSIRVFCGSSTDCGRLINVIKDFVRGHSLSSDALCWLRETLAASVADLRIVEVMAEVRPRQNPSKYVPEHRS